MKLSSLVIFSFFFSCTFFSCTPIYKCGEAKPEKRLFLPKIILNVIHERDSLCTTLTARDNEIYGLKKDTTSLNNDIKKLEKRYDNLTNDKLSQAEQFNAALKQKSDELTAKEKLLASREKCIKRFKKGCRPSGFNYKSSK